MEKLDVAIIGAGPSGIFCARRLAGQGKKIAIFEKSRNIGGRLAARRFDGHVFNIGVNSFHSTAEELNEMVEHGIENETLIRDGVEIKAKSSITDWTKGLVKGLDVRLQCRLLKVEPRDNENILHFKNGQTVAAKDVILSAPAPQVVEILDGSEIEVPRQLKKVRYSSAVFYMLALNHELKELAGFEILHHVHYAADNDRHYYLLSFLGGWSEKSKEELREEFDETFRPIESYVHKWKYAKVQKRISSDCQMALKDKSIYLTGDYFYGDDMDSAVLSAQCVLDDVFNA